MGPWKRCVEDVKDLHQLEVRQWRRQAQNRDEWKQVVLEAPALRDHHHFMTGNATHVGVHSSYDTIDNISNIIFYHTLKKNVI